MNYELMLVASAEKADQLLTRVEKSLKELGAAGIKVDRLGKKVLAYPIKKHADGVYFLVDFEAGTEAIKPFSDKLRLEQEDLLRYLLLKKEKISTKKSKKMISSAAESSQVEKDGSKTETKPKVTVVTKTKVSAKVEKKKAGKAASLFATHDAKALRAKKASEDKKVSKAKKA